jgi:hypothetical protein
VRGRRCASSHHRSPFWPRSGRACSNPTTDFEERAETRASSREFLWANVVRVLGEWLHQHASEPKSQVDLRTVCLRGRAWARVACLDFSEGDVTNPTLERTWTPWIHSGALSRLRASSSDQANASPLSGTLGRRNWDGGMQTFGLHTYILSRDQLQHSKWMPGQLPSLTARFSGG